MVGIPWLKDGDDYEKPLESCLRHLENQDTSVKTLVYKTEGDTRVNEGIKKLFQITRKLNDIIEFSRRTKATHTLFLDADIELPVHALDTMIRRNVGVVSGVYYPRGRKDIVVAGTLSPHIAKGLKYTALSLDEVVGKVIDDRKVAAGNGCMLVQNRVFKKIHADLDPLRFRYHEGARGSDIQFFIDVQQIGFKAIIDGTILCGHLPDTPLSELDD